MEQLQPHPHIIPVLEHSGDYYVMPYAKNGSLKEYLAKKEKLVPAEAVRFASQIAGALQFTHDKGIVHCNVYTRNILLQENFDIWLGSYSSARKINDPYSVGWIAVDA